MATPSQRTRLAWKWSRCSRPTLQLALGAAISLSWPVAAQSTTGRLELPRLEAVGGAVVLHLVAARVECARDGESTVQCAADARYELTNEADTAAEVRVAPPADVAVSCTRERAAALDCGAAAIAPRATLEMHVRSEHRVAVAFERAWAHDDSLQFGNPHGTATGAGARHPITGSDWGRTVAAPLRIVWSAPRGIVTADDVSIRMFLYDELELAEGGVRDIGAFGAYRARIVARPAHGGFLGGINGALGYERHAGFAGRIGYEATFGQAPVALEVAFESAKSLGPGVSNILWVYTPTVLGIMGAGAGVGPAFRFADGTHAGTRLAFDLTFFIDFRVMITFERDAPRQTGFYLGVTL